MNLLMRFASLFRPTFPRVTELSSAIFRVADAPDAHTRDAFYAAFLRSRVEVRVPPNLASVPSGKYTTTPGCGLTIPVATLPTGEPALLVLADIPVLSQREQTTTFVELDGRDVLRIARQNQAGVLVQVLHPQRDAWAGISPADVRELVSDGEQLPSLTAQPKPIQ